VNGPAHYVEAERLLFRALDEEDPAPLIAAAAVHAQLAAVAVSALNGVNVMPDEDFTLWDQVAGVPSGTGQPAAAGPPPVRRRVHLTRTD
jgi:hypothetical protein